MGTSLEGYVLSFSLLGQAALSRDGIALERFRSQKEPALLFYLAHTGQVHPRESVADLLWDDRSSAQARSNLRTVLTRLRRKVGDGLTTTRTDVSLAPEHVGQVDSAELLDALADFGPVDSEERAVALQQILSAYGGEFLVGFSLDDAPHFEEWVTITRAQIHRRVVAAYHTLTNYAEDAGKLNLGIGVARSWVHVDPVNDVAHTQLIQLLIQAGNIPEAKAQYDSCVHTLRTELDVEPSPELTALIQDLLRQPPPPANLNDLLPGIRHNLPAAYDRFFGRVKAQNEIHDRLDQPWCRLVTIVGQGGVGKTRLATTIARGRVDGYADGVWLVELADINPEDDDLAEAIAVEIATVLQLRLNGSVPPIQQLLDYLQFKEMLLVLDNFEHLVSGVAVILNILQRCERVQMMITSREALRVRAEWRVSLAGLSFPDHEADETPCEAVSLFLERRAQQQRRAISAAEMPAVRTICRMVEGLPLGIELAAALTQDVPVQEIADRLRTGFDQLASALRDVPDRHRSLSVAIETSWQTMRPFVQRQLARLSVFHGGFTAEAARHVAAADAQHLASLCARSLVISLDPRARYTLHPVVQAYATEKLAGEDRADERHRHYYLSLLARHADALQKDAPQHAVAEIVPDLENVRLAWQRGLAYQEVDLLSAALTPLSVVYQLQGLTREAESVMQATVDAARDWGDRGLKLAIRAGLELARFQNRRGQPSQAALTVQQALGWVQQAGDDPWAEAMGQVWWGESLWRLGQYDLARQKLGHALAIGQQVESVSIVGWCHHQFGIVDDIQGRFDSAHDHLVQACAMWRDLGNARALGATLNSLGLVHYHRGDLVTAQATLEEALAVCTQTDNRHLQAMLFNNLSIIATEQGDHVGAQYHLQSGLILATANGNLFSQADIHMNLALTYVRLERYDQAAEHVAQGMQIAEATGNRVIKATAISHSATLCREQGDIPRAESLYCQALSMAREDGVQILQCDILINLAELLSRQNPEKARQYSTEALALAQTLKNPTLIDRAHAIDRYLRVSVDVG